MRKLFACLQGVLPASICNLNKVHWHRKVIACYCNFSTSAQHSSISTRQRPQVYESPRLKISNFQSHCVSTAEDATVHLGWVMRQADNAALWMRENQLAPAHTCVEMHAHTRTHKLRLISALSRAPFKRPESWRRGNKYSALLLRERQGRETRGCQTGGKTQRRSETVSHTQKQRKTSGTSLVLAFIYLFRQHLVNVLQIKLVAAYLPSLVQGEIVDFEPLIFCFKLLF